MYNEFEEVTGWILLGCLIGLMFIIVVIAILDKPAQIACTSTRSNTLQVIADDKLDELITTDHWDHTNADGCDFDCRVDQYLGEYEWIGENLYKGRELDVDNAYRMWEESPTHKHVLDHEYSNEAVAQGCNDDNCYIILIRGME